MNKIIFIILAFAIPYLSLGQGTCPSMYNRNNGNGGASSCPGAGSSAQATDVSGTSYQYSSCCGSLTKEGDFFLKWTSGVGAPAYVPAVKNVYVNGVLSTVKMGPPSPFSSSGSDTVTNFCFYTTNVANGNVLTIQFVNPLNDTTFATCNYAWSSGNSLIAPNAAPSITTQPQSQTACVGASITFSVAATPGTPGNSLTYQWTKNNTNISGATNTTYTINPVALTDSAFYTVVVTESNGAITSSSNAWLTTKNAPTLTNASNSGPVCSGNTLTLSANGALNVTTYSWSGPVAITSSTSATATVPAATTAASGTYSVTVTNGSGTNCSAIYTTSATVNALPNISNFTPPTATSPCLGASSTVTVNSTSLGAGTFTVTYNLSGANSVSGHTATLTMGGTNGTFIIPSADLGATGSTTVTITQISAASCATSVSSSNTASFTVNANPNTTGLTASGSTVCASNASTITIGSSLTNSTYTFNYTLGAPNAGTYNATSVSTTGGAGTFSTPSLTNGGSTSIAINTVTNAATGCSSSSTATNTITVNSNPNISNFTSPSATAPCVGSSSTVTVNSTSLGAGTFTVTYNLSGANTATGHTATLTMGTSSGTFVIPSSDLSSTGSTTVTITQISAGSCATAVSSSNTASFNVNANPNTTGLTVSGNTICAGNLSSVTIGGSLTNSTYNFNFTLGAPNVGTLNATGVSVTGGSGSFFSPNLNNAGTTSVTINTVTDASTGCSSSSTALNNIIVNPNPNVTGLTVSGTTICTGNSSAITIGSPLTNSTYTFNYTLGAPNAGTYNATSVSTTGGAGTFSTPTLSNAGTTSIAINTVTDATTACSSSSTASNNITVNSGGPDVSNFTSPSATSPCLGASSTITVNSTSIGTGTFTITYNLSGANSATGHTATLTMGTSTGTFSIPSADLSATGSTTVTITQISSGSCASVVSSSNTATFNVNPLPDVTGLTVSGSTACTGSASTITIGSSLTNSSYIFNFTLGAPNTGTYNTSVSTTGGSGTFATGNLANSGTTSITINSVTDGTTLCASLSGASNNITVNPSPAVTGLTVSGSSVCSGNSSTITIGGSLANGIYNFGYTLGAPNSGTYTGTATTTGGTGTFTTPALASAGTTSVTINSVTDATTLCSSSSTAINNITVNAYPVVAAITGNTTLSTAITTTLSDATGSGAWASGTTGVATIGSSTGVVSGVSAGTAPISYTVTTSGCSTTVTTNVTVNTPAIGLNLDGSNDYVITPNIFSEIGTGSLTIEVWFNSSGAGVIVDELGQTSISTGWHDSWIEILSSGQVKVRLWNLTSVSLGTASFNTWHHAVIRYDASSNKLDGLLDGVPSAGSTTGGRSTTSATYLAFGAHDSQNLGSGAYFNGTIDEVRIWKTARSNSQIQNNMNCDIAQDPNLIAYYRFDQGTAGGTNTGLTTAADYSGNNNCATLNNFALTGSTSNYVVGAVGDCNPISITPPGTFSGNAPVCVGSTITLSNANTGGTWSTASSNVTINSTSGVVTGVTAGSATVNYTLNCSTSSVTVTVNAQPSISGGSNVAYCNGSNTTLTASGGVSYTWSPATGLSASTGGSVTASPTSTTTYTVTGIDANSCTNTSTVTVTVNPLPNVYAITGGGSYCSGGAGAIIGLSGSDAGVNYQLYKGAAVVGSPVSGTGSSISFAPAPLASTAYHAVATNATTGCTNNMSGTTSVSILTSPAIVAMTGGGSVCGGGPGVSIGLAGSAIGISYQLYLSGSPTGSPVNGVGSGFNFGTFTTLGTYTATATNTVNACTSTMSGTAVVTSAGSLNLYAVTGGGSYCSGGTGVAIGLANSDVGNNYQLFLGTTAMGSPIAGTGSAINFGLWTSAGTYTVVATKVSTGCTSIMTGSATITINPLPTGYAVTGGGSYCSGSSGVTVGLSLSQSSVNYQLYNGASPVGSPVAGTGSAISFGLQTAAGTYSVIATDATTSCTNGMLTTVTVSVNPVPTVTASGSTTICAGSPTGLSASGALTYSWSPATALSATTGSSVTASPASTIAYTVTGTDINGCSNTNVASVTINPLPAVSGGSGAAICNGSSTGLTASGALTYTWTPSTSLSATTGASVTANPTSTTTYTVTGTDVNGCVNAATVTVTVNAIPTVSVGAGAAVCTGSSTSLTASGATTYTWSPSTGLSATTGTTVTAGPTTLTTYTVTGTAAGCSGTATATVSVNPLPSYSTSANIAVCSGSSTALTAVATGDAVNAIEFPGSGSNYINIPSTTNLKLTTSNFTVSAWIYANSTGQQSILFHGLGCSTWASWFLSIGGPEGVINANKIVFGFRTSNSSGSNSVSSPSDVPTGTWTHVAATYDGSSLKLYVNGSLAATASASGIPWNSSDNLYAGMDPGCSGRNRFNGNMDDLQIWNVTRSASEIAAYYNQHVPASTSGIIGSWAFDEASGSTITDSSSSADDGTIVGSLTRMMPSTAPIGTSSGSSFTWSPATSLSASTGTPVTATPTVTTTYTVTGTDANGCVNTASVTVTVNALPTISAGSNVAICNGISTVLTASGGITYSWSPARGLSTTTGASVTANPTTTTTYTVTGTNAGGCAGTATVTVTVNTVPTVTGSGGGTICSGASLGLSASGAVTYTWSPSTGLSATTGASVTANPMTTTVYTVTGTDGLSCTNTSAVTVTVNPLPNNYAITGGGSFCSGTTGVPIGLAGSDAGVNYQLYRTGGIPVGSAVAGTGAAISFGSAFTTSGTYTVIATNATTGCTLNIAGSTTITPYPSPAIVAVTGGGSYCAGGTGVAVGVAASAIGVNYQLYLGASPVGAPVAGIGYAMSFGSITAAGTYTVTATNAISGCSNPMSGSATVSAYPALTTYSMTGGGSYCSGGSGVSVGLNGSDVGTNYQLYLSGSPLAGTTIAGTGAAISFGSQTTAGSYTVVATSASSGCTANMSGLATVTVSALPTVYTVTGGGSFCTGGAGVAIGLSNSQAGVNYQLYLGSSAAGSPVAGTGSAISFGSAFTTAGTYTVVATNATTSCSNNMSGSATVTVNSLPTVYTITGGGSYCSGPGLHILLSGSNAGINYQLYNGASPAGSPVAGTGSGLDFGAFTSPGTYTAVATNATTSCASNMTGSATITGISLPTAYNVTGGGSYCAGGSGFAVGLSSSDVGVNYQLYRGGTTMVGSAVAGTGTAITFGLQTIAGTYTVVATNATLGCTSNMTGSATIVVNPLPVAVSVLGGGSYCSGGTGVNVGLSGSAVGINYQLYNGVTPVGSPVAGIGSAFSFGLMTAAGPYTATATNPSTGCTNNMSGSATVTINALPGTYSVTGGGSYCSGGSGLAIGLGGSQTGVNYQLYNGGSTVGSAVAGTGIAITFGIQTAAGTYTVSATSATTSCTNNMTGSATITVNALPTIYAVTGGGSYCSGGTGVAVGLANSDIGVNYQLYNGGTAVGSPVAGTGASISFGLQTAPATFTVIATNATTGCTKTMSGSATVSINILPAVISMTGGGTTCTGGAGIAVGLAASVVGVNYQLYRGGSPVGSAVAGIGSSLSFGLQSVAGTYTATAINATTGCTSNMSGSAVVSNYPALTTYSVTGGGSYCSGGTGVTVGLGGSDAGVTYQLYRGVSMVGSPVSGTGAAISFGLQTTSGTYTVIGTNTSTTCTGNMTGSATVSVNTLPTAYAVTGGGGYCSGGSGVAVGLSNSDASVNYQLYLGGSTVGSPVAGTGTSISFGSTFTTVGTYTVVATNTTTTCINSMSGSATVSINSLPTVYTVSGGGSYCSGPGVHVYLSNSTVGVNYQLYNGASPVGGAVAGTGSNLDFGTFTSLGTYTVVATNATTSCTNNMSGSAVITGASLPTVYTVTGGGSYCSGGSGVHVGLNNSDISANYQLYLGAATIGSPVAGTGTTLDFGLQTAAGTYTVVGINPGSSCTSTMSSSAVVSINALPTTYAMTGGGVYCAGGTGLAIGLANSDAGVNYQLYKGGTTVGSPIAGTSSSISFGLQTAVGTYTVTATDATTSCTLNMSGSATISTNPLPTAYTVTGGGSYCTGGTGVAVGLTNSQSGVNYQLYNGVLTVGTPVAGTGAAISFGLQTAGGTYTVIATNATTSCTSNMTGSATITVNMLPTAYSITGGGSYCSGGTGVAIGLASSDPGINYQLRNGGLSIGSPVAGTGAAISFGLQTSTGTYTVVATNTTTGCINTMTASTTVSINPLPAVVSMTGGGSTCVGGTGLPVGLAASAIGINYQLYRGGSAIGSPVAGVGGSLSFGSQSVTGTYTATAANATTGCTDNMSGSAVITNFAGLTLYSVTGGGSYCMGGTGVAVGLSGSDVGVNYQLYRGGTTVGSAIAGTGGSLSFGLQTTAGVYTVVGTSVSTGCITNMTGSVTVTINTLLTVYTVSGGGAYCSGGSGVAVSLSNSDLSVNYQLYRGGSAVGSPVVGTGSAINFGLQTSAGTYTVVATNATTSCTNNMTGSATVTVNALPNVYSVTGGGAYCSGAGPHVYVNNSDVGVNYQLYNGASPVGSPIAGTGTTLDMGPQSTLGTYTVTASNVTTGCSSNMSGSASVTGFALPTIYSVAGGGSYCIGGTGVTVGLSGSDFGVSYQLYNGGIATGSAVAGTNAAISFGLQTSAGTYTVIGTNTSSCVNTMSGSATVTVNSLPTVYAVTGGGSYCTGGTGVTVGISNSDVGINYQLYRGGVAVGSPVSGTGSALSFGLQTTAGTYTVVATDASTLCTSNMSGSASVSINTLPAAYSVTGGGAYCAGGIGVLAGLSGSQAGVNYQLYYGAAPIGSAVSGTGAAISFGFQTTGGTYTVVATNGSTLCTNNMTGSATVTVNALPNDYAFTGGSAYCSGGSGVNIGLGGSDVGISYQLYSYTITLGTVAVGSPVIGTGAPISFGLQTTAALYSVVATNTTTGCTRTLSGSTNLIIYPLPAIMPVTGGGSYCAGGSGIAVSLPGSAVGINYQLYRSGITVGTPVAGIGTGFSFGLQTVTGSYTVIATNPTTGCTSNMSGSATVSIYPALTAYSMTGGGSYCSGSTGVTVGLGGSTVGVNYQLYEAGSPLVGTTMAGTGAALSFGLQTVAGSYTVVATNTSTTCTANMSGAATVSINALPTAYVVTGGGSYCSGGTGVTVGLANSDAGVNYQLYRSGSAIGTPVAGTGAAIGFGLQTTAGTYTVAAANATTSCTNNMSGSASVSINSLPTAYTVTGGGSYCTGPGPHVLLSGSNYGMSYQLYVGGVVTGSTITGTGGGLDFGAQSTLGTYTVIATNTSTGCTNNMTGSAIVGSISLPAIYSLTGGGSYCTGGTGLHVGLSGSSNTATYQLYRGGITVGSAITGTGIALDFGLQTIAGTYTVVATNVGSACTSNMSGSATISINALPVPLSVTGGGSYCAGGTGVNVGLIGSAVGINYQLYLGASPVGSPAAGTGTAINYGLQTTAGTYTVTATNSTTGCTSNMTGSTTVSINSLPTVYSVTGGGSFCSGGTGVTVGLSGSQLGVNYQLYNGASPVGSVLFGTGSTLSFGTFTSTGTYTVVATNVSTSCTSNMTGSATVTVNVLPTVFNLTGGGSYCSGGSGVHVGLSNSAAGVNYQLYQNGTAIGSPMAGTGALLDFGAFTAAATYTVRATNATTGCVATMSGSATITINALPTVVSVTGGGGYCSGGTGMHVGLGASIIGTNYQLYNGGSPVGTAMPGNAGSLDFGLETAAGTYTVVATNATTGCTNNMSGSATVTVYALPAIFSVTGGGSYCTGGTGVHVQLSGSTTSVTYKLFLGGTPVAGGLLAGTGAPLDFGLETGVGAYTATAVNNVTGCTSNMSSSASISITPLPVAGTITGFSTVHNGASITLTDPTGTVGGTWSSSSTAIVTIGSSTGIATGVSLGYANIFYTVTNACGTASTVFTVHDLGPTPPPEVGYTSGNTSICIGGTTMLTNSVSGGTWSSDNQNVATIDAVSGVVKGESAGIAAITYTLETTSGTQLVFTPVVVNTIPDAIAITAQPGTTITNGEKLTLTASVVNGAGILSYQWFVNKESVAGATNATYTNSNFNDNDEVSCQVYGECGVSPVSGSVIIKVGIPNLLPVTTAGASNIKVIPNPNKGIFLVKGTLATQSDAEISLVMTDVLGQVVYSDKITTQNGIINIPVQLGNTVPNGMYLLTVHTAGIENKVFHVIIEQ